MTTFKLGDRVCFQGCTRLTYPRWLPGTITEQYAEDCFAVLLDNPAEAEKPVWTCLADEMKRLPQPIEQFLQALQALQIGSAPVARPETC